MSGKVATYMTKKSGVDISAENIIMVCRWPQV